MVLQRECNVALCCTEVVVIPKYFLAVDPLKWSPCKPGKKTPKHITILPCGKQIQVWSVLHYGGCQYLVNASTSAPAIFKIFRRN